MSRVVSTSNSAAQARSCKRWWKRLSAGLSGVWFALSVSLNSAAAAESPTGSCAAGAQRADCTTNSPKRALPDYDGLAGRGHRTTAGEVALWVPRVILFPLYLTSEYLIRRPLGFLITSAERADLPAAIYDFLAFGPDHKAGFVPIGFVDFGFEPSVGLYVFWDDAGFKGHQLRLHGSTWGGDWISGMATERFHFGHASTLTLNALGTRRPDYTYYGIGPNTRERDRGRYGATTLDARAQLNVVFWGASSIEAAVGYRSAEFRNGSYHGQTTVKQRVASGVYELPPGYVSGYAALVSHARITLDTRKANRGSGGRLELDAEHGAGVFNSHPSGWLRYGGALGGLFDLADRGRILSVSVAAHFAEPLTNQPVPFTELVALGGADFMPGFRPGRLYGRSAAVATLRYAWPIWVWLHGSMQAAVGNVFGRELRGFDPELLRFSGAIGIESHGSSDSVLQLLLGMGTRTFEDGGKPESFRLQVGARSGF